MRKVHLSLYEYIPNMCDVEKVIYLHDTIEIENDKELEIIINDIRNWVVEE